MSLLKLINRAVDTPVDFSFIKRVVGKNIRMVDHESSLGPRPTLKDIFKGKKMAAILLHILQGKSKIGHWVLLINKRGSQKISFFDSLGLGLYKLYQLTHEQPKLLHALNGHAWENSKSQLQRFGESYRECGSQVAVRGKFYRLSNAAYVKLIKSWNKTTPDQTAVLLTLLHYIDEDPSTDIQAKNYKRVK